MVPWLWFWAPQIHWPFSGAVTQDIAPETFFGAIPATAGDGRIERRAFEEASYGRQLGWLTEVLLAQAGRGGVAAARGEAALDRLETLHGRIETIKRECRADLEAEAEALLTRLAATDDGALQRVLARHRQAPAVTTPARAAAVEAPARTASPRRRRTPR